MKLRGCGVAGLPGLQDHLSLVNLVVAFDQEFACIRIGGHEAVRVTHQHEVAVAFQLVARIGDDAVFGGAHRGAFGEREVDAVVGEPFTLAPKLLMMRPRTGHRNAGAPFGPASADGGSTGDAKRTLAAASDDATLPGAAAAAV